MAAAISLLALAVAWLARRVFILDRLSKQQFAAYVAEYRKLTEVIDGALYLAGRVGELDSKVDATFKTELANHKALARHTPRDEALNAIPWQSLGGLTLAERSTLADLFYQGHLTGNFKRFHSELRRILDGVEQRRRQVTSW